MTSWRWSTDWLGRARPPHGHPSDRPWQIISPTRLIKISRDAHVFLLLRILRSYTYTHVLLRYIVSLNLRATRVCARLLLIRHGSCLISEILFPNIKNSPFSATHKFPLLSCCVLDEIFIFNISFWYFIKLYYTWILKNITVTKMWKICLDRNSWSYVRLKFKTLLVLKFVTNFNNNQRQWRFTQHWKNSHSHWLVTSLIYVRFFFSKHLWVHIWIYNYLEILITTVVDL